MNMTLSSSAFANNESIPERYTCEGADVSPPLAWHGVPARAVSLALIVDDPDAPDPKAPQRTWVHWVLYNAPVRCDGLPEGAKASALLPMQEGQNDWRTVGYRGPCPPIGRHRYFFKLYALDAQLPDLDRPTKARLLSAMQGHVLSEAHLIGTYEKREGSHRQQV
jgi:Raf kinase inhibitor-like YbhB/YbcL family protein